MIDGVLVDTRLILGGTFCLTIAAWLALRRYAVKNRACRVRYCPRCGFDIAARLARCDPVPMARPVTTIDETPHAASGVLPSDLLRADWSRTVQPAADAAGRPVFSDSPDAVSYTIWAAGNRAFDPGSRRWASFIDSVQSVLRERYGENVQIGKWNRAAPDQETVVSVAEEAQRRMQQDYQ